MFKVSLTDMAVKNNPELYQLVYDYLLPQFFLGVLVLLVNGTMCLLLLVMRYFRSEARSVHLSLFG